MEPKDVLIVISITTVVAFIYPKIFDCKENKKCNRYEQLVDNKIDNDLENDSFYPTTKDVQEYFKPPAFKTWFTNNVFCIKDLEIGKVKNNMFFSYDAIPVLKLSTMNVSNNNTIVAYDPEKKSSDFIGDYLEFTYKGLRYQICCFESRSCHPEIFGRIVVKDSRKMDIVCNICASLHYRFWKSKRSSVNLYIKDWVIGSNNDGDECIKVYRDDEDKIIVEFYLKK